MSPKFLTKIVLIELVNGIVPHTDSAESRLAVWRSMGQSANHLTVVAPCPTGKVDWLFLLLVEDVKDG